MTKHIHHEAITAWANGESIEWSFDGKDWRPLNNNEPRSDEMLKYRVRSSEQNIRYPETAFSADEVGNILNSFSSLSVHDALKSTVNYCFKHACNSGQIVTREEFDRAVGDRAARDMNIAVAIGTVVEKEVRRVQCEKGLYRWGFEQIIAGVKP